VVFETIQPEQMTAKDTADEDNIQQPNSKHSARTAAE